MSLFTKKTPEKIAEPPPEQGGADIVRSALRVPAESQGKYNRVKS